MYFTKSSILSVLGMASAVSAHTVLYTAWVNGVDQGDGRNVFIRSPPSNSPIKDLASPDLVCNVKGGTPVPKFVSAAAGDKITFEWYHNNRDDDIIALSHEGPIITYIAEYTETNGASSIWSKIAEDGFSNGKWAVDRLVANQGKYDFTIPPSLKKGKYLIRQEVIALHEADATFNTNPARGAQFYPVCVQFEITGSGSAVPDENFNFNTGYTYSDPGIYFNLYTSYTSYPIPGPALWPASGSGSSNSISGSGSGSSNSISGSGSGSSNSISGSGSGSSNSNSGSSGVSTSTTATTPPASQPTPTTISTSTKAASTQTSSTTSTAKPSQPCSSRRRARAARRAALARADDA